MTLDEVADRLSDMAEDERKAAYLALRTGGDFTGHIERNCELSDMVSAAITASELIDTLTLELKEASERA